MLLTFTPVNCGYLPVMLKGIKNLRPLIQHMQELLMECHERELLDQEPCDVGSTLHAGGLLSRGLLEIKHYITHTGKRIMAMYVTDQGREYLDKLK